MRPAGGCGQALHAPPALRLPRCPIASGDWGCWQHGGPCKGPRACTPSQAAAPMGSAGPTPDARRENKTGPRRVYGLGVSPAARDPPSARVSRLSTDVLDVQRRVRGGARWVRFASLCAAHPYAAIWRISCAPWAPLPHCAWCPLGRRRRISYPFARLTPAAVRSSLANSAASCAAGQPT